MHYTVRYDMIPGSTVSGQEDIHATASLASGASYLLRPSCFQVLPHQYLLVGLSLSTPVQSTFFESRYRGLVAHAVMLSSCSTFSGYGVDTWNHTGSI